jgi:hypothetical protein
MYNVNKLSVKIIKPELANNLVLNFHYMKTKPAGAKLHFGIFHEGIHLPQGVAIFGKSTGTESKTALFDGIVGPDEIIEMQRLWISDKMGHNAESKVLSLIMAFIKKHYPQIKVVWTYAGGCKNDCGIVYQSSGFMYLGSEKCNDFYLTKKGEYKNLINVLRFGKAKHLGSIEARAEFLYGPGEIVKANRHYYFYPISKLVRRKMQKKTKTFPKYSDNFRKDQKWVNGVGEGHSQGSNTLALSSNLGDSTNKRVEHDVNASGSQSEESCSNQTDTLHLNQSLNNG